MPSPESNFEWYGIARPEQKAQSGFSVFLQALRSGVENVMKKLRNPDEKFEPRKRITFDIAARQVQKEAADAVAKDPKADLVKTRTGWIADTVTPGTEPENKSRLHFTRTLAAEEPENLDNPYYLLREGMRLNARTNWRTSGRGSLSVTEREVTQDVLQRTYDRIHVLRQQLRARGEQFQVPDHVVREGLGLQHQTALDALHHGAEDAATFVNPTAQPVGAQLETAQMLFRDTFAGAPTVEAVDQQIARFTDMLNNPAYDQDAVRTALRRLGQLRWAAEENRPVGAGGLRGGEPPRPPRPPAGGDAPPPGGDEPPGGGEPPDRGGGRPPRGERPRPRTVAEFEAMLSDVSRINVSEAEHWVQELAANGENVEPLKALIREKVRYYLSILETRNSTWREDSTFPGTDEGNLYNWLTLGRRIVEQNPRTGQPDTMFYDQLRYEAAGRHWLHGVNLAIATGASPTDIKRFLEQMQEFKDMGFHEAVARIPAVARAFQLLEANGTELVRNEHNPPRLEALRQNILMTMRAEGLFDATGKANVELYPEAAGLDDKTVLEIARRMFKETGRDAWYYRQYIQSDGVIKYTVENGNTVIRISDDAPLMWDGLRMAYAWDAMWSFFNIGGNMNGVSTNVKIAPVNPLGFGALGPPELHHYDGQEVKMGQNVGAEVRRALKAHGFSTIICDVFSRRKGMILDAWISEYSERLEDIPEGNPTMVADLQWLAPSWEQGTQRGQDELKALGEDSSTEGVKRHVYRAAMMERFAARHGLPMFDIDANDIDKKINSIGDAATRARLARVFAPAREAITSRRNGVVQDDNFFADLSRFDVRDIYFTRIRRLQENFRGNTRDHMAALGVVDAVTKFIGDPNIEALQGIRYQMAIGYTGLDQIQAKIITPVWYAFEEVQRSPMILGKEWGLGRVLPKWFRSKYGQVRDVDSLTEHDLERLLDWQVAVGNMSHDLRIAILGGGTDALSKLRGRLKLWVGRDMDPMIFWEVALLLLMAELAKLEKDLGAGGGGGGGHGGGGHH